jgi:hypothetical protein
MKRAGPSLESAELSGRLAQPVRPQSSHSLPNRDFWEDFGLSVQANLLISMVGAHGLEPWTR